MRPARRSRARSPRTLPHALLGAAVATALFAAWPHDADPLPRAALAAAQRGTAPAVGATAALPAPAVVRAARFVAPGAEAGAARRTPPRPVRIADAGVDALVRDLADDGIRGNAIAACAALCALPRAVVPALESALGAIDAQQRVLAGAVLRVRCDRFGLAPSEALLANSVEALRGGHGVDTLGTPAWPLAATSFRFLLPHAAAARAPLLRALEGGAPQQRLAAAYLLAGTNDATLAPRLVRELVPYLSDNHTGGDALFAAHALYRVGESGLVAMREWRAAVDAQGRSLLELVELDLREPPRDRAELRARGARQRVTSVYHDPVVEYDPWRSALPLR